MRSSWKGDYYPRSLVALSKTDKFDDKKRFRYRLFSRSSFIPSFLLGNRVLVHVGNRFSSVVIRPEMVNLRFGQFYLTKRLGTSIHSSKKKGGKSKRK